MTTDRLEGVYAKVQALASKYDNAKTQLANVQARLETSEHQNLELQLQHEQVADQVNTTDGMYKNLQESHRKLVEEKGTLETMLNEAGEQLTHVNKEYVSLQKTYESEKTGYEQALIGLHTIVEEKETAIVGLTERVQQFATIQTDYETKIVDYIAKLATANENQTRYNLFLDQIEALVNPRIVDMDETPDLPPLN